jgi:hypothetical protein
MSPNERVSDSDEGSDLCDDEHSWNISNSYDPDILEGHDTSWIPELLLVANDPRKKRAPRTFLCGPAHYDDVGWCDGTYGGGQYGVGGYDCRKLPLYDCDSFRGCGPWAPGSYPCHVPCLEMLARAITDTMEYRQLDRYVLHQAMYSLCEGSYDSLRVDYGDVSGRDQFWVSYPGEEVREI